MLHALEFSTSWTIMDTWMGSLLPCFDVLPCWELARFQKPFCSSSLSGFPSLAVVLTTVACQLFAARIEQLCSVTLNPFIGLLETARFASAMPPCTFYRPAYAVLTCVFVSLFVAVPELDGSTLLRNNVRYKKSLPLHAVRLCCCKDGLTIWHFAMDLLSSQLQCIMLLLEVSFKKAFLPLWMEVVRVVANACCWRSWTWTVGSQILGQQRLLISTQQNVLALLDRFSFLSDVHYMKSVSYYEMFCQRVRCLRSAAYLEDNPYCVYFNEKSHPMMSLFATWRLCFDWCSRGYLVDPPVRLLQLCFVGHWRGTIASCGRMNVMLSCAWDELCGLVWVGCSSQG